MRQGAVTQKLSREEIRGLFQQAGAIRFDLSICTRFRYPSDFDPDKYVHWQQKSTIFRGGVVEDILTNIEVAERAGDKLLFRNAGVLFFARDPRRFFNQAYVTCLLFKGTSKVHVLDRKDFAGGVVADIEDSLRFIERNTRTAYRIEKLQREEIPQYPMAALREAITNAVMHRDWYIDGANVFVEIYEDRIEVSSPGGLPKGMLPEDLGSKSVRRNPLIADVLHRIAFIEKAGTGIRRMREGAVEQGYPEPEFRANGFFTAIFRPLASTAAQGEPVVAHDVPVEVYDDVLTALCAAHDVPVEVYDDVLAAHDETVIDTDYRILVECVNEPQSTLEMIQHMGYRARTGNFRAALNRLLTNGYLEMTIPDKPRSHNQRYRATIAGRLVIENCDKGKQP